MSGQATARLTCRPSFEPSSSPAKPQVPHKWPVEDVGKYTNNELYENKINDDGFFVEKHIPGKNSSDHIPNPFRIIKNHKYIELPCSMQTPIHTFHTTRIGFPMTSNAHNGRPQHPSIYFSTHMNRNSVHGIGQC